jgi:hypothetical protein
MKGGWTMKEPVREFANFFGDKIDEMEQLIDNYNNQSELDGLYNECENLRLLADELTISGLSTDEP